MFALFYSLYFAMFTGTWSLKTVQQVIATIQAPLNYLGKLVTSIFNNVSNPYETLGSDISNYALELVSFVLALITSIGIVVMAVKGIKRIFSVFFYGVR